MLEELINILGNRLICGSTVVRWLAASPQSKKTRAFACLGSLSTLASANGPKTFKGG